MSSSQSTLETEVRYFNRRLFSGDLPVEVIERYVAANELCLPEPTLQDQKTVQRIIAKQLDVECVELVLRLRRKTNPLTVKLQILFYLLEVRADYFSYFINTEQRFGRALGALLVSAVQTAFRYVKGSYLVWRHSLA